MWIVILALSTATSANAQTEAYREFNELVTRIRDQKINRDEAIREIAVLKPKLDDYYHSKNRERNSSGWVFPLKGYSSSAIGGKNGNGYIAAGYRFLDGNKHGGHPAHDIFINDANQDCIDDKTQEPVEVLSCNSGVVVAIETNWRSGSEQRGGNYILIYAPDENRLLYYAHNQKVLVQPGDIVQPGDRIGFVGRTGTNACKQRSPTHLHLMTLQFSNNLPVPENPYEMLKRARVVR